MNEMKRAENAVMWYLFTHGKREKLNTLLHLDGFNLQHLTGALNSLSVRKEIVLSYSSDTIYMAVR